MPIYRTLRLTDNTVAYVETANKAQARSHVARKIIQVELATPAQMQTDVLAGIAITPEVAAE